MASERAGACGCGIESQRGRRRDGTSGAGRTSKASACAERQKHWSCIGPVFRRAEGAMSSSATRRYPKARRGGLWRAGVGGVSFVVSMVRRGAARCGACPSSPRALDGRRRVTSLTISVKTDLPADQREPSGSAASWDRRRPGRPSSHPSSFRQRIFPFRQAFRQ